MLSGLRVGVLGLAFKPGTDDVRDAPALDLVRALADEGVAVTAYDPRATEAARPEFPASVRLARSVAEAAGGAQALVLMTEWCEIVQADWAAVARRMVPPQFLFDGRNALDPAEMAALGFEYMGVGRNATGRAGPVSGGRGGYSQGVTRPAPRRDPCGSPFCAR